jgi:MFS family permease
MALPALAEGPWAAGAAAVLFGGTFMGAVALAMAAGRALAPGRAVAILTAGYALGQIVGPALAGAVAGTGYRPALFIGSAFALVGAAAAATGRTSIVIYTRV